MYAVTVTYALKSMCHEICPSYMIVQRSFSGRNWPEIADLPVRSPRKLLICSMKYNPVVKTGSKYPTKIKIHFEKSVPATVPTGYWIAISMAMCSQVRGEIQSRALDVISLYTQMTYCFLKEQHSSGSPRSSNIRGCPLCGWKLYYGLLAYDIAEQLKLDYGLFI